MKSYLENKQKAENSPEMTRFCKHRAYKHLESENQWWAKEDNMRVPVTTRHRLQIPMTGN